MERRGSSVLVPADIAAALRSGSDVHLGTWSDAQLIAAGVARIRPSTPGPPEFASRLERLDPAHQEQEVAAALSDLIAGGLVLVPDAGAPAGTPAAGSALELIAAVSADPVFFATLAMSPAHAQAPVAFLSGMAQGVQMPGAESIAILDARVDRAQSRRDYRLRTPGAYVTLVAQQAFSDAMLPPDAPRGREPEAGMCMIDMTWAHGSEVRDVHVMAARRDGEPAAALVTRRSYGRNRDEAALVDEEALRSALAALFAQACRVDPAGQRLSTRS